VGKGDRTKAWDELGGGKKKRVGFFGGGNRGNGWGIYSTGCDFLRGGRKGGRLKGELKKSNLQGTVKNP